VRRVTFRNVSERDIDFLLLEELVASSPFRAWFLSQLEMPPDAELTAAARSVTASAGESDLELTFETGTGDMRVMIENKLDAVLQPRQGERYAERAAAYRASGACARTSTVLVAPRAYGAGSASFDHRVAYEAILAWLETHHPGDVRMGYKAALLRQALERSQSGWTLLPSEAGTLFWARYWELAHADAPELAMPRPGTKPATSNFVRFRPAQLPPRTTHLLHKVPYGHVDLQFSRMSEKAGEFERRHGSQLDPGMTIQRAHKSLVVRIDVPRIQIERPFELSLDAVRQGVEAARRLLAWYGRVRPFTSSRR
jgi:hypothetical protein